MPTKEEERKQRQLEIARLTAELTSTVPTYKKFEPDLKPTSDVLDSQDPDGPTIVQTGDDIEQSEDEYGPPQLAQPALIQSSSKINSKSIQNNDLHQVVDSRHVGQSVQISEPDTGPEAADTEPSPISDEEKLDRFALSKKIPISHSVDLGKHNKAVACISVDSAGNRVVSGSVDHTVKLFDFGGMDSRHQAFKSFEAVEGHLVNAVAHSSNGDRFIVATGSAQAKVFDRDGNFLLQCTKGDMYLRDLSNTKGHTMELTGASWHPTDKESMLTSSLDGSLRLWDLAGGPSTFGGLINKHVLKIRGSGGAAVTQRIGATCCAFGPAGKYILAGASDGTVHVWQERKSYSKADVVLKAASSSAAVTCVAMLSDLTTVIARHDGCIVLWNIKKPQTPVKVFTGISSIYPTANFSVSPDEALLVCTSDVKSSPAATSSSSATASAAVQEDSSSARSMLCFYEITGANTSPIVQIRITGLGLGICVQWVATTNQIFCGTSTGHVRTFYDPRLSKKGAMLSAGKVHKRQMDPSDFAIVGEIINPHALPMYRVDIRRENKRKKEQREASVPQRPSTQGPGQRINTSFFFTQYVTNGQKVAHIREEDPREALLKMQDLATKDPMFLGKAYKESQPKTVLLDQTFEEEQEEFKKRQRL